MKGTLVLLAVLALPVSAEETKSLDRTEDLVVLTGAELAKLKGVPSDLIRVYASKDGDLLPIPFQVDERTPELEYCWRTGPDPVKDVDDGRLDEDDEVALSVADSGDRTTKTVAGATARVEIELEDPANGRKAWVYVLAFDDKSSAPPPRSERHHVEIVAGKPGGARIRTQHFEVASVGSAGLTGRPTGIRLRGPDGATGPEVVKDAARFKLRASYLLARIERDGSEARTSLGTSWIEGPVRAIAPVTLEAYLIWGNWISSSRSYVVAHDHTWELHARFSLPVNLDREHASEATLALEPGDGARAWRAQKANGLLQLLGPEGAVGARLELDARLRAKESATDLAVDLQGLRKSEEATPYEVTYVVTVLPKGTEAALRSLMTARDKPLRHAAR